MDGRVNGISRQFALRLLAERNGHRSLADSRIIIVPARAIATSIDRINNDGELPPGNTLQNMLNRRKGWIKPNSK
jgi:hypothetical protein